MNTIINTIKLNEVIEYEDLFQKNDTSLKAGQVTKIIYWINLDKKFITYDIQCGDKKYVNIDDEPTPAAIKRVDTPVVRLFELYEKVEIEVAGIKRPGIIEGIVYEWEGKQHKVTYGVTDQTNTTHYGILEKQLLKWNQ
ncbi:hypothetical protein [Rossellomorea aquimaris]|uniref:hypothetical protein n=1 Tax=Rossellomorea aquimaris TaxID=189382 RepID=UPI0007D07AF2|nr:hypothetical protein [Rossellomorea aquimaris]